MASSISYSLRQRRVGRGGPEGTMKLTARGFWLAKDDQYAEQYEDAFGVNGARGVAAIADGVSSALFSGDWARLLVEGTLACPPDPSDEVGFLDWLTVRRQ